MRRAVPAAVLLALVLTGCASPQADLQDQVAEVTVAANGGDVAGLLAEAQELERLVDRLEESGELTRAQATGLRNAAVALQQRAGQLRPAPSPVPTVEEPEPVETTEPPEPEPVETTVEPEPEPVETTEPPEPTAEPEPTEEPDSGVLPLPTAERTRASEQPQDGPTTSPVAAATSAPATPPATRARGSATPSPTASARPQA